jgi:hypothetical protein
MNGLARPTARLDEPTTAFPMEAPALVRAASVIEESLGT